MARLNIEKSFLTENKSVIDFLHQPGQGLYIPLYQREYSWDSDNIDQLLEDLLRGIQRIASGEVTDESKEIRFLGTIITVVEPNKNSIHPVDLQAVPPSIEKIIDGQQRVSTIALMATLLVKRLMEIRKKVKTNNPIYNQIEEICDTWINKKLVNVFSFDLGRGTPGLKPKIIRGNKDFWTRDLSVDEAYKSELSNYLGMFIQSYVNKEPLPSLSKEKYGNTLLYQNGKRIETWLKKIVALAHEEKDDNDFAKASDIVDNISQDALWEYERKDLVQIIKEKDFSDKKCDSYVLSELVQTLAVCHYLLDRCCFTIIKPVDEDWAFDMFQSLNATGTPLTAIETFKPMVVNTIDSIPNCQFKDSRSDKSFKKVEDFLSGTTNAQQKNKRTNDYLTSFFIAYVGKAISTHFSHQRKELQTAYDSLRTIEEKELFVKKMGDYAEFYQHWINYDAIGNSWFPNIGNSSDAELASMLIMFLKVSNHRMAITVLGNVYGTVMSQGNKKIDDFINVVKYTAAYYFLWRSAYSNSGLDATYRDFFKKNKEKGTEISIDSIKTHYIASLTIKGIATKEQWKNKAKYYLKYDETSKEVLRMAILMAAHDTMPDENDKGLIKEARKGTSEYICLSKWLSSDLKTIEHIAPQKNENNRWDEDLYDTERETYQTIGNLTLLPQDLNSSAGNKSWKEKLLYYQCVAEKDPVKIQDLETRASAEGINLIPSTIEKLQGSQFSDHLSAISTMSPNDAWNKDLVDRRTDRMLDIIWNRVSKWIFE